MSETPFERFDRVHRERQEQQAELEGHVAALWANPHFQWLLNHFDRIYDKQKNFEVLDFSKAVESARLHALIMAYWDTRQWAKRVAETFVTKQKESYDGQSHQKRTRAAR